MGSVESGIRELLDLVSTLRAENERLREALESISKGDGIYGAQAWEYKRIAKEALK